MLIPAANSGFAAALERARPPELKKVAVVPRKQSLLDAKALRVLLRRQRLASLLHHSLFAARSSPEPNRSRDADAREFDS
jgi:hypothetical protein